MLSTLAPPAAERAIREAEQSLSEQGRSPGARLPVCLRLLYRFHNGQLIPFVERPSRETFPSITWGMFGGTSFYDKLTTMRLLSLDELAEASEALCLAPTQDDPVQNIPGNFYQHHTGHRRLEHAHYPSVPFAMNVNFREVSKVYYIGEDEGDGGSGGDSTCPAGGGVYTNTGMLLCYLYDTAGALVSMVLSLAFILQRQGVT
jgi:hypothetical protein